VPSLNPNPLPPCDRGAELHRLREELRRRERSRVGWSGGPRTGDDDGSDPAVSTGAAVLDRLLPDGGLTPGAISEWRSAGPGCGAATLAWLALRQGLAARPAAIGLVVDPSWTFHPAGAGVLGLDLDRLLVARPRSAADALWTAEQALRCPGVAAVLWRPGHVSPTAHRRLKLAAETGGGLGLFLRDGRDGQHGRDDRSSWADVRWRVDPVPARPISVRSPSVRSPSVRSPSVRPMVCGAEEDLPAARRLRVELVSCRTGRGGAAVIEICDETGLVREAPRLAPPAGPARTSQAFRRSGTGSPFGRTG
jgi:protein ImuA